MAMSQVTVRNEVPLECVADACPDLGVGLASLALKLKVGTTARFSKLTLIVAMSLSTGNANLPDDPPFAAFPSTLAICLSTALS